MADIEWFMIKKYQQSLGRQFCINFIRLVEDEKEANEMGTLESIKTKILIQGDIEAPECIKVELTSEADLFFHYTCMVTPESFAELRDLQQLNVGFDAFIGLLIRMFNNVHKEPHVFFSIQQLQKDGKGKMDFIQNLEYKYVDLVSIEFETTPQEIIREAIPFKYNSVKAKMIFLQNRMKEFTSLIKTKNPAQLLQMQKSLSGGVQNQTHQSFQKGNKQASFNSSRR